MSKLFFNCCYLTEFLISAQFFKKTQIEGNNHTPYKKMDVKDFGIGAQILHKLNITKIKLLTTKDRKIKRVGMAGYGLEIVETVKF